MKNIRQQLYKNENQNEKEHYQEIEEEKRKE